MAVPACCLGVVAMATSGCGGGGGGGGKTVSGKTLTIYSSLPLQGSTRLDSESVNNGAKLALKEHGGKVGKYTVRFKPLDDSTAQAGKWDPSATQQNARKAVQDKTTIAYIGEFNSGATANSLPVLNKAGILQVSPSNTAVGLTTDEPGADKGEPDKYYPTGKRTYGRVVPRDTIQAAAIATTMKQDGCTKAYIVNDKEVYGQGLANASARKLKQLGVQLLGNSGYDPKAPNYRSLAASINSKGADCIFGSLIIDNNGTQLFKDFASGVPKAKLYGPDGVAEETFTDPKQGGVPASIAPRIKVTVATLAPDKYPPEGRKFFKDYQATYGKKAQPYAIYGYEAMSVILDAIKRAGSKGNERQAVIDQFFKTRGRRSVLGTYDIDKNGDTTITDYGLYRIKNGSLAFVKTITAQQ